MNIEATLENLPQLVEAYLDRSVPLDDGIAVELATEEVLARALPAEAARALVVALNRANFVQEELGGPGEWLGDGVFQLLVRLVQGGLRAIQQDMAHLESLQRRGHDTWKRHGQIWKEDLVDEFQQRMKTEEEEGRHLVNVLKSVEAVRLRWKRGD